MTLIRSLSLSLAAHELNVNCIIRAPNSLHATDDDSICREKERTWSDGH